VLADRQADNIYRKPPGRTGVIPTWVPFVPGTRAALFHRQQQVTKEISTYIRDVKHTPAMKEFLIRRPTEATGRDKSWDETIYVTIGLCDN
jgi:hypothetical protein